MKILVTVKQVPDTSGKVAVNPDGTLDRASMQTIINPDDLNAVEAALSLKDELGCKVVAFTMGPPPAEGMLRELMAMGVVAVWSFCPHPARHRTSIRIAMVIANTFLIFFTLLCPFDFCRVLFDMTLLYYIALKL